MNVMSSLSIPLTATQTPGGYMRACRQRAGLKIRACAEAIAVKRADQLLAMAHMRRLERDVPGDYGRLVRSLRDRAVFPFDFTVFAALAAETCDADLDEVGDVA